MPAHETLLSARVGVAKSQGGESPTPAQTKQSGVRKDGETLDQARGYAPTSQNPMPSSA